jgi:uncharacterized membrane protein YqiK
MKTLTDRKVAHEQKKTYETQEETEKQRQKYLKESSLAEEQKRLVEAEQSVFVAKSNATSTVEAMKGEAESLKLKAEAEASVIRTKADAEAESIQKVGKAKADAYKQQADALGADLFTNMEMIKKLAENNVKLTPDILVNSGTGSSDGNGTTGLLNVLLAKNLTLKDEKLTK